MKHIYILQAILITILLSSISAEIKIEDYYNPAEGTTREVSFPGNWAEIKCTNAECTQDEVLKGCSTLMELNKKSKYKTADVEYCPIEERVRFISLFIDFKMPDVNFDGAAPGGDNLDWFNDYKVAVYKSERCKVDTKSGDHPLFEYKINRSYQRPDQIIKLMISSNNWSNYNYFMDCELRGAMWYMFENNKFNLFDPTREAHELIDRINHQIFNRMTFLDVLKMNSKFRGFTNAKKFIASRIPKPMVDYYLGSKSCNDELNHANCWLSKWIAQRVLTQNSSTDHPDESKWNYYAYLYDPLNIIEIMELMKILSTEFRLDYNRIVKKGPVLESPKGEYDIFNHSDLASMGPEEMKDYLNRPFYCEHGSSHPFQDKLKNNFYYKNNDDLCLKQVQNCHDNTALNDHFYRQYRNLLQNSRNATVKNRREAINKGKAFPIQLKTICGIPITYLKALFPIHQELTLQVWKNMEGNGDLFLKLLHDDESDKILNIPNMVKKFMSPANYLMNDYGGNFKYYFRVTSQSQQRDPFKQEKADFINWMKKLKYEQLFKTFPGSDMGKKIREFLYFVGPFNKLGEGSLNNTKTFKDNEYKIPSTEVNSKNYTFHKVDPVKGEYLIVGTYRDEQLVYFNDAKEVSDVNYITIWDTVTSKGQHIEGHQIIQGTCAEDTKMFDEMESHKDFEVVDYACKLLDLMEDYIIDHFDQNDDHYLEYNRQKDTTGVPMKLLKIALKSHDVNKTIPKIEGRLMIKTIITHWDMVWQKCPTDDDVTFEQCKARYRNTIDIVYQFEVTATRKIRPIFPMVYKPNSNLFKNFNKHILVRGGNDDKHYKNAGFKGLTYMLIPKVCKLHYRPVVVEDDVQECHLEHQRWDFLTRKMYVDQVARPNYLEESLKEATSHVKINEAIRLHQSSKKPTFNKCVSKFYKASSMKFQCKISGSQDSLIFEDLPVELQEKALKSLYNYMVSKNEKWKKYEMIMSGRPAYPTQVVKKSGTTQVFKNSDGELIYAEEVVEGRTHYSNSLIEGHDRGNIVVGDNATGKDSNTIVENARKKQAQRIQ